MKTKLILLFILCAFAASAQPLLLNGTQVKKDGTTITTNALRQLTVNTANIATVANVDLKVDSVKRHAGTDSVFYYTNGTEHFAFIDSVSASTIAASAWSLTGNSGTNPLTNYLGTNDSTPVRITPNATTLTEWKYGITIYPTGQIRAGDGDNHNLFIGVGAGELASSPATNHSNVGIGHSTLLNVNGAQNTAVGGWACKANTTGQFNTGIGDQTLLLNETGSFNTGCGWQALHSSISASENTGSGAAALFSTTSGTRNTAVGMQPMYYNETGSNNVAVGYHAGLAQGGNTNVAIGSNTLAGVVGSSTASDNTAVGSGAAQSITTGGRNLVTGMQALFSNTTGTGNVISGYHAALNVNADHNTVLGYEALLTSTAGARNSSVGYQTLYTTLGNNNVGIGYFAGHYGTFTNHVWIDNLDRTDSANQARESLIHGVTNTDSSLQTVQINAVTSMLGLTDIRKGINTTAGDGATIDAFAGRFRKDTSGTTFTLTNALITANSIIVVSFASDPGATGYGSPVVVAGAGSAVITFMTAGSAGAPGNDTDVNFVVVN